MKSVKPCGGLVGIRSTKHTAVDSIWWMEFQRPVFCRKNIQTQKMKTVKYNGSVLWTTRKQSRKVKRMVLKWLITKDWNPEHWGSGILWICCTWYGVSCCHSEVLMDSRLACCCFILRCGYCFKWAGHVANMKVMTDVYRVWVGKPEEKTPLVTSKCRWEDNIKMDIQEIGWGVDCSGSEYGQAAGSCVHDNETSWRTIRFSRRTLFRGVRSFFRSLIHQCLTLYSVDNDQWIWKDAKGNGSSRIYVSTQLFARRYRQKKKKKKTENLSR
jgi:hypothetical protein